MFSCREVTRLNSERLDRPLSRRERFFAAIHMLYCSACRNVRRQLAFLHHAMAAYRTGPSASAGDASTADSGDR